MLDEWQEKGATVIRFSSPAGVFGDHFPVDTVANIIDLWTWTGEFVAACTRLGHMPVLYQSLYIDPGWPLADGCVTVPGYDVPSLPASGVVQAAIYWTVASERARLSP
jgi:hypothetical protein